MGLNQFADVVFSQLMNRFPIHTVCPGFLFANTQLGAKAWQFFGPGVGVDAAAAFHDHFHVLSGFERMEIGINPPFSRLIRQRRSFAFFKQIDQARSPPCSFRGRSARPRTKTDRYQAFSISLLLYHPFGSASTLHSAPPRSSALSRFLPLRNSKKILTLYLTTMIKYVILSAISLLQSE